MGRALGSRRGCLGGERVWALEDCRHVSGSFERFLIGRGERVLWVTAKLMPVALARQPRPAQHRCEASGADLGRLLAQQPTTPGRRRDRGGSASYRVLEGRPPSRCPLSRKDGM